MKFHHVDAKIITDASHRVQSYHRLASVSKTIFYRPANLTANLYEKYALLLSSLSDLAATTKGGGTKDLSVKQASERSVGSKNSI